MPPHHTTTQKGTILDARFEILEEIGRGGFATVYKAKQLSLGKLVAIKILSPRHEHSHAEHSSFEQRFIMEARSVAKIHHPSVVTVIDHGFTEQNQAFMVMELLDGHTLEQELQDHGPMEPSRALPLLIKTLDGLDAAHALQLVHKDLKPSNLFVHKPGTLAETLTILDFGIVARADATDDARLTARNQYVGTAAYCCPAYYETKEVSPALDVYQMALVLAEVLMGQRVVQAQSPVKAIMEHCAGTLRLPWAMIQSPLGPILRRALQSKPQDRYTRASDFRDALSNINPQDIPKLHDHDLQQMVLLSHKPTGPYQNPKFSGADNFLKQFTKRNFDSGETIIPSLDTPPPMRRPTPSDMLGEDTLDFVQPPLEPALITSAPQPPKHQKTEPPPPEEHKPSPKKQQASWRLPVAGVVILAGLGGALWASGVFHSPPPLQAQFTLDINEVQVKALSPNPPQITLANNTVHLQSQDPSNLPWELLLSAPQTSDLHVRIEANPQHTDTLSIRTLQPNKTWGPPTSLTQDTTINLSPKDPNSTFKKEWIVP